MDLNWLKKSRQKRSSTRAVSGKEEKKLAGQYKMRKHKNSGACELYKGDMSDEIFLGESKTTNNKEQILLRRLDLLKLNLQSARAAKIPFFTVSFKDEANNWVIINDSDFEMFLELYRTKLEVENEI